jgi:hypothetical protein
MSEALFVTNCTSESINLSIASRNGRVFWDGSMCACAAKPKAHAAGAGAEVEVEVEAHNTEHTLDGHILATTLAGKHLTIRAFSDLLVEFNFRWVDLRKHASVLLASSTASGWNHRVTEI